jgi:hypothetical protein
VWFLRRIIMADKKEINKLIKTTSKITNNFHLKYENDMLKIVDAVEGLYGHEITNNDCYKLSEIFKKLGDELSK